MVKTYFKLNEILDSYRGEINIEYKRKSGKNSAKDYRQRFPWKQRPR